MGNEPTTPPIVLIPGKASKNELTFGKLPRVVIEVRYCGVNGDDSSCSTFFETLLGVDLIGGGIKVGNLDEPDATFLPDIPTLKLRNLPYASASKGQQLEHPHDVGMAAQAK